MFVDVAAAASVRGQRVAIMASPLHELMDAILAVDCPSADCRGERKFAIAELAALYRAATVGDVLPPDAERRRLWRTCACCLAGDRANSQRKGQAAAGATARAGGPGVAVAGCCLDARDDRPIMTAGRAW